MKLIKCLLLAFPVMALSPQVTAVTTKPTDQQASQHQVQAEKELRNLLADYDGFSAQFAQTVTDSENNLLHRANGKLVFKRPGQFRWQVSEPEQELLLSNGETLWWYNPFLEQVSIYDADRAVSTTPFALLVSNQDDTWAQFTIEKVESGYLITPKDSDNAQVQQLAVHFNDLVLDQIVITDRTQQISAYELTNQGFDKHKGHQFNFVIPADVDIDDQRELNQVALPQ